MMNRETFLELCYKVAEVYDDCSNQEEFEEMVGNLYQEYFKGDPVIKAKPYYDLAVRIHEELCGNLDVIGSYDWARYDEETKEFLRAYTGKIVNATRAGLNHYDTEHGYRIHIYHASEV